MLRSLGRLAPGRLRVVHVMWRWDVNKETGFSSGLQGLRDPPASQPFVLARTHAHTHPATHTFWTAP